MSKVELTEEGIAAQKRIEDIAGGPVELWNITAPTGDAVWRACFAHTAETLRRLEEAKTGYLIEEDHLYIHDD